MNLAHLIHTHKGDRTYRQLEHDCHSQLGAARWNQLASHPPRAFPTADTIAAIATGLGISERTVILAAGESLGLHTNASHRLADLIPAAADRLPAPAIATILACINTMIALYEGMML